VNPANNAMSGIELGCRGSSTCHVIKCMKLRRRYAEELQSRIGAMEKETGACVHASAIEYTH
jgi:hypothetical protein